LLAEPEQSEMPPNDYAPYKSVVPNSGIATASPVSTPEYTPEELAYLAEQRAAAEPWSSYLGAVARNAGNVAQGFLPTFLGGRGDIGVSDIVTGAAQSAVSGATLPGDALAGRVQVFDPSTGRPTEEVLRRGADFTGLVTFGAGAIPAEANALRAGVKGKGKSEAKPQMVAGKPKTEDIELIQTTAAEARKIGAGNADLFYKDLPDDAPVSLWRANPEKVNNVSGEWRALAYQPKNKKELLYDLRTYYEDFMEGELDREGDLEMRRDDLHRLFGKRPARLADTENAQFLDEFARGRISQLQKQLQKADEDLATYGSDTPEGKAAQAAREEAEGGLEHYYQQGYTLQGDTDVPMPNASGGTTLNMGPAGFLQRGYNALFAPEGRGGGGGSPRPKGDDRVLVVHGGSDFGRIDKKKLGTGEPGGIRPLGEGLYGYVVPTDNPEMAKQAIEGAQMYARKYGKGEKTVHVFSVPKSALLTSNGPIPLEGFPERQLGEPGKPTPQEEIARYRAESQLYAERLPSGLVELSILDPSIATRVGKFKADTDSDSILGKLQLEKGGPRQMNAHPYNPVGSTRRAEVRDGFYNKSEELLSEFSKKQSTVAEYKAFLEQKGVKKAEMQALGLDNLEPESLISKDKIINKMAAFNPKFRETFTNYFEADTMPGGTNYRMLNVQWTNPNASYGQFPFQYSTHYLPDNTLFHARLKDDVYTGADGLAKKVLRVEELQSDWAQRLAGKWALPASSDRIEIKRVPLDKVESTMQELHAKAIKKDPSLGPRYADFAQNLVYQAQNAGHDTVNFYRVKGVQDDKWQMMGSGEPFTPEEFLQEARDTFGETLKTEGQRADPMDPVEEMLYNEKYGEPVAPYVTQGTAGWVPLATKKLLLEAAKNGQDEIVIAPGAVHAERWGGFTDNTREGLLAFYDSVLPKEMGKVLKDVEKESGIKGLKIEAEERPFVDLGTTSAYDEPGNNVLAWAEQGHINFDRYFPPENYRNPEDLENAQLNAQTLLRRIVHKMEVDNNTPDEAVTAMGNNLRTKLESTQALQKSNEDIIARYQSIPYDQMTKEQNDALMKAFERADVWERDIADAQSQLAVLPYAHQMYKDWESNVKAPADTDAKKAWVIKLSPDLREFILKNGLPRFAKGGIVDLVERAAYA
jgi:hypothetical protein